MTSSLIARVRRLVPVVLICTLPLMAETTRPSIDWDGLIRSEASADTVIVAFKPGTAVRETRAILRRELPEYLVVRVLNAQPSCLAGSMGLESPTPARA